MSKVILIHNRVAPYRIPIFEEISKECELTVLFLEADTDDRHWDSNLENSSFDYHILSGIHFGPIIFTYSILLTIIRIRPDIIISADSLESSLAVTMSSIYAQITDTKYILWSEVIPGEWSSSQTGIRRVLKKLVKSYVDVYRRFLYGTSDVFVAYSGLAKKHLRQSGVADEIIFSGIQTMPEANLQSPNEDASLPDIHRNRIVLYLGYLREGKGVDALITAWKQSLNLNGTLLIAGSGDYEHILKNQASDSEDILFLGHVESETKAACYECADLFVLPSRHDAWGLVINEALYFGLPVITTEQVGASELIRENNVGKVIKSADPNILANTIKDILQDDKQYKRYCDNANDLENPFDPVVGAEPFMSAINTIQSEKKS